MIDIQASAPGKVFIAGEYVVLDGAAAICIAVDRRAHVSITGGDSDHHSVRAPGYSKTVGRFTAHGSGLEWLDGAADFPLLAAVWQEVAATPVNSLKIVLDSNEFMDFASGSKIGIGSSAALTVALTAALDLAAGGGRSVDRIAADAHRHLQGGVGSGADIACSLSGGVIEYRIGEGTSRVSQWPTGLHYALLWSGVAANTGEQLARLANFGSVAAGTMRAELVAAANDVAKIWSDGQVAEIIAALHAYTAVLRRFDADHELGIFAAGHAELASKADLSGVVYKPCGAGGGDLGIAIASDAAAITAFIATAREQNFKHLRMAIEATGLRCDGERL